MCKCVAIGTAASITPQRHHSAKAKTKNNNNNNKKNPTLKNKMKTNKNPQKAAKRKSNAHAESGPGLQVTRGYGTAQEILRFDLNFTLWYNGAQFSRSESVLA